MHRHTTDRPRQGATTKYFQMPLQIPTITLRMGEMMYFLIVLKTQAMPEHSPRPRQLTAVHMGLNP